MATEQRAEVERAIVVALKHQKWVTSPQATGYAMMRPVDVHAVARVVASSLDEYGYLRDTEE